MASTLISPWRQAVHTRNPLRRHGGRARDFGSSCSRVKARASDTVCCRTFPEQHEWNLVPHTAHGTGRGGGEGGGGGEGAAAAAAGAAAATEPSAASPPASTPLAPPLPAPAAVAGALGLAARLGPGRRKSVKAPQPPQALEGMGRAACTHFGHRHSPSGTPDSAGTTHSTWYDRGHVSQQIRLPGSPHTRQWSSF